MIEIRRYVSGLLFSNMYVLAEGNHAIVIDPFEETFPSFELSIDYILLTHEHYDHISGVNAWKKKTGAPVMCSAACAANIQSSKKNLSNHFRDFCEIQTWITLHELPISDPNYVCSADKTFENETKLQWEGHEFVLFEIPGHSPGSTGILLDGKDFFSGDSLMENSEIELRLPGGSRKKWEAIGRKRIEGLPDGIRIWPGHFNSFIWHKPV